MVKQEEKVDKHKNKSIRTEKNMEKMDVGTKRKSLKQGLTSAKELT